MFRLLLIATFSVVSSCSNPSAATRISLGDRSFERADVEAFGDELVQAFELGRFQEVLRLGRKRLERNAGDARAHYYIAHALRSSGAGEMARGHFEEAQRLGEAEAACSLQHDLDHSEEFERCEDGARGWKDQRKAPTFAQFLDYSVASLASGDDTHSNAAIAFFEDACDQSLWLACVIYLGEVRRRDGASGLEVLANRHPEGFNDVLASMAADICTDELRDACIDELQRVGRSPALRRAFLKAKSVAPEDRWAAFFLFHLHSSAYSQRDPTELARAAGQLYWSIREAYRIGRAGDAAGRDALLLEIGEAGGPGTVLPVLEHFKRYPPDARAATRLEAIKQTMEREFGLSPTALEDELRCRAELPPFYANMPPERLKQLESTALSLPRVPSADSKCKSDQWR